MNYLVLARRYRPATFSEIVGQEDIVRTLANSIHSGRIHHAWLLSGTRGVGKTSLARILSKSLNCKNRLDNSDPCNTCKNCLEISSGRCLDHIELDAASNRGVEDISSLLDNISYHPSYAPYRIYIIDEAHMLSNHAFNAMLKSLEDPPKHVKFILATTEPKKIPQTILSRCLHLNLKKISTLLIRNHLEKIFSLENIEVQPSALELIAYTSSGSMRDALTISDQVINTTTGNSITEEFVRRVLNMPDSMYIIELLKAIIFNKSELILQIINQLEKLNTSYVEMLKEITVFLSKIAIEQRVPNSFHNHIEYNNIHFFSKKIDNDLLQLLYAISISGCKEMEFAPDQYSGFIMVCFRMLDIMHSEDIELSSSQEQKFDHNFEKNNATVLMEENMNPSSWPNIINKLNLTGLAKQIVQHSEWCSFENESITIKIPSKILADSKTKNNIEKALSEFFKKNIKLIILCGETGENTLDFLEKNETIQLKSELLKIVKSDKAIKDIIDNFDGEIIEDSIKEAQNN